MLTRSGLAAWRESGQVRHHFHRGRESAADLDRLNLRSNIPSIRLGKKKIGRTDTKIKISYHVAAFYHRRRFIRHVRKTKRKNPISGQSCRRRRRWPGSSDASPSHPPHSEWPTTPPISFIRRSWPPDGVTISTSAATEAGQVGSRFFQFFFSVRLI